MAQPDYGFYPEMGAQSPDILGNYLRGVSAPTQLALGQQQLQMGGLQMQQLRMALQNQGMLQGVARQQLIREGLLGEETGQGAPSVGRTGGIQNGPQDAVAGTAPSAATSYVGGGMGPGLAPSAGAQRAVAMLEGKYTPETENQIFEHQKQVAQFNAQPMLDTLDTIFDSDKPAAVAMNNPNLIAQWPQLARQMNLDPVKDFNDQNVRRAIAFAANNIRGSVGMAAKDYPVPLVNGPYGSQYNPITGKRDTNPELPEFNYEKKSDVYGNESFVPLIKKPGFGSGGMVGGAGQAGGAIPGGVKAPTEAEERSAGFAQVMGINLPKVEAAENKGVFLAPRVRTQLLDIVVNPDPGAVRNFLSQEFLKTIPQAQRNYIYAALPMLQAIAHQQAGQKGMTQNTLRANLESQIPQEIDKDNPEGLATMHATRRAFLATMDAASGSLGGSPDLHEINDRRMARAAAQSGAPQMPSLADIRAEIARRQRK
jgi:hypothetical protein